MSSSSMLVDKACYGGVVIVDGSRKSPVQTKQDRKKKPMKETASLHPQRSLLLNHPQQQA